MWKKDDDAAHYTWGEILTATRLPKVTLFTWVDSFTLLALRYAETVKDKISRGGDNQDQSSGGEADY
jgi:hypothetical protein